VCAAIGLVWGVFSDFRDNLVCCVPLCSTPVAVRLQYGRRGHEKAKRVFRTCGIRRGATLCTPSVFCGRPPTLEWSQVPVPRPDAGVYAGSCKRSSQNTPFTH
jgi:hypothetical protein